MTASSACALVLAVAGKAQAGEALQVSPEFLSSLGYTLPASDGGLLMKKACASCPMVRPRGTPPTFCWRYAKCSRSAGQRRDRCGSSSSPTSGSTKLLNVTGTSVRIDQSGPVT